jgi:hypothetical protein
MAFSTSGVPAGPPSECAGGDSDRKPTVAGVAGHPEQAGKERARSSWTKGGGSSSLVIIAVCAPCSCGPSVTSHPFDRCRRDDPAAAVTGAVTFGLDLLLHHLGRGLEAEIHRAERRQGDADGEFLVVPGFLLRLHHAQPGRIAAAKFIRIGIQNLLIGAFAGARPAGRRRAARA